MIGYRGEGTGPAVDGQCGRILGVYREHQMSADGAFLRRIWPARPEGHGVPDAPRQRRRRPARRRAGEHAGRRLVRQDRLDQFALRRRAARLRGDGDRGRRRRLRRPLPPRSSSRPERAIETELFNGEYFIQKPEPGHEDSLGTYQTCHIDQVHGQSWAWQVGLGRVLDRDKTVSALKALYKYNFTPDVGPFRRKNTQAGPMPWPATAA